MARRRTGAVAAVLTASLLADLLGMASPALAVSSPVARWKLDDGNGSTANDDVGAADGTLTGNPTWLTSGAAVGTGALRFDGTNDNVSVPSSEAIEPGELMLTLWVRGDPQDPPSDGAVIVEKGAFDCLGPSYGLYVWAGGLSLKFRTPNDYELAAVLADYDRKVELWDGAWHFLALRIEVDPEFHASVDGGVTIDGFPMYSLVGGDYLNNGQHTSAIKYAGATSTDLVLGAPVDSGCGGGFFDGDIDDVRIYADPAFQFQTLMPTVTTTMTGIGNPTAHPGENFGSTVNVAPTPRWGDVTWQVFADGAWTTWGTFPSPVDNSGNASGSATAPVAAGAYPFRATFSPGLPYLDSTQSTTLTVEPWPTTTTLSVDPDPFNPIENVLLRASVQSTWMPTSPFPVGSVKFWETTSGSPVLLGTASTQLSTGLGNADAFLYAGSFEVGTHTVVAEFVGPDPARSGSTSTEKTVVVEKFTPTVMINKANSAAVEANSGFTLTAQISNAYEYAAGATYTFTRVDDPTPICTVPVVLNGVSTCDVPGLPEGSWQFVASYSGNATTNAAESSPLTVDVVANVVHAASVGTQYPTFYPVKDNYRDSVAIKGTREEPISGTIRIYRPTGSLLKTVSIGLGSGPYSYTWNGRKADGSILAEGKYRVTQTLTDGTTSATFTSYVSLSKKKLYRYSKTITKLGSSLSAKGAYAGTVTINSTAGYVKLRAPDPNFSDVAAGWEFTLPSASVYTSVVLRVYGRHTGTAAPTLLSAQDFAWCPYVAHGTWYQSCFVGWKRIPSATGSTLRWYSTPALPREFRSGRHVRALVESRYGTTYIYKARVVVHYGILRY